MPAARCVHPVDSLSDRPPADRLRDLSGLRPRRRQRLRFSRTRMFTLIGDPSKP